jgi:hypothetical protein
MAEIIVNPRGEVHLPLVGKSYPMLPTPGAAIAIEAALNTSIVSLVLRVARLELRLTEMAVIAEEGIKAAGRDRRDPMLEGVKASVLAEKIYEAGLLPCTESIGELLGYMMHGGAKKKADDELPPTT